MIELMLQAERALTAGMVDQAERLYRQAIEHDPRNSIAIVGLARVALERDDDRGAYQLALQALAVDPENAAAQRLATRMAEVLRYRGEDVPGAAARAGSMAADGPDGSTASQSTPASAPGPGPSNVPSAGVAPATSAQPVRRPVPGRPSFVRRLLGRR